MSLCIFGLCSHAIDELINTFYAWTQLQETWHLAVTYLEPIWHQIPVTPITRVSLLFQVDTLIELRRVFMLIQCGRSYIFNDPMNN